MSERSSAPTARPTRSDVKGDLPSPDIAEFIRFCHHRRQVSWPELYDEMCAVAARREFHGWDTDELARRGLTFTLFDMPRVAAWVRAVVTTRDEVIDEVPVTAPRVAPQPAAG
jgi:hypothetical protein